MLELYFVQWLAFGKIEKQRRWRISSVRRRILASWRGIMQETQTNDHWLDLQDKEMK